MPISYSSSLPQFSQPTKPLISPMNGSNKNSTGSNNRQISLPPISSIIKQDSYPQSFPYYSPPPFNDAPYNHQLPHPQSQYPALTVPPPSTQHRVALPFEMPAFEGYQHSYNMSNDYHYNLQKPPLIRKASPLNHQLNPIISPSTTAYSSPVNNTFSSINPQQTHSAPTSATSAPAGGFPPKHPEFNKTTIVKKSSPTPKKSPSNDKVFAFISHSPATFPSQEPSIDNAQLARRKRRRTSSHELSILQNEFELGSNPNRNRRQEIAVKVKMDEKAVQIWFQNKRQSLKRCKLKKSNKEKAANTSIPEVSGEEEDEEEVNNSKVLDTSKETTPLKTKETSNSPSSTPSKSATISRKNSFDDLSSNQTTISKDFSQSSISHPTTPNKAT